MRASRPLEPLKASQCATAATGNGHVPARMHLHGVRGSSKSTRMLRSSMSWDSAIRPASPKLAPLPLAFSAKSIGANKVGLCPSAPRQGDRRPYWVRNIFVLPDGYHTERDADVLTLLRADGSVVARFSARGVKWPEVERTAAQDYGIASHNCAPRPRSPQPQARSSARRLRSGLQLTQRQLHFGRFVRQPGVGARTLMLGHLQLDFRFAV